MKHKRFFCTPNQFNYEPSLHWFQETLRAKTSIRRGWLIPYSQ